MWPKGKVGVCMGWGGGGREKTDQVSGMKIVKLPPYMGIGVQVRTDSGRVTGLRGCVIFVRKLS